MRPLHVFSNFAVSMDGKISTKDRVHINPSKWDRYLMDWHRSRADAILVGAETMRAYGKPLVVKQKHHLFFRKIRGKSTQPLNIILSRSLEMNPDLDFFQSTAIERLLVCPKSAPKERLAIFQKSCSVLQYDEQTSYPQLLINHLSEKNYSHLLLEGGGTVMFDWAKQDLVDEWNITFVPKIIGGQNAPTMVEGEGFSFPDVKKYHLKRHFSVGNEIFSKYVK